MPTSNSADGGSIPRAVARRRLPSAPSLAPFDLTHRGSLAEIEIQSVESTRLAERDVAARQAAAANVALAGGRVRIPRVTDHVRTNTGVIRAFGYALDVDERPDGSVVVSA